MGVVRATEARRWTTAIAVPAARSGSWATWTTPGSPRSPTHCPRRRQAPLPWRLARDAGRATSPPPGVVVLHRSVLTRHDAETADPATVGRDHRARVVLCHGPHVRYADLERWAELVDAAVPEATARETIARRLSPPGEGVERGRSAGPRPRVAIVSTNAALRQTLAEAVEAAGYPVDRPATGPRRRAGPAVWDVPVLEPDWPRNPAPSSAGSGRWSP